MRITILTVIGLIIMFILLINQHKKTYAKKIEGETIKIDDAIVIDSKTEGRGSHNLELTVKYLIENKEYQNEIYKQIQPICLYYFLRGKTVSIIVDKEDYNNVLLNPDWLYEIGGMLSYDSNRYLKMKNNKD